MFNVNYLKSLYISTLFHHYHPHLSYPTPHMNSMLSHNHAIYIQSYKPSHIHILLKPFSVDYVHLGLNTGTGVTVRELSPGWRSQILPLSSAFNCLNLLISGKTSRNFPIQLQDSWCYHCARLGKVNTDQYFGGVAFL